MPRLTFLAAVVVLMVAFVPDAESTVIHFHTALEPEVIGSSGSGIARVTYDSLAHTLEVEAEFQDLTGPTTVAHIHCCVDPAGTVGVATYPSTFPGFPAGVFGGSYLSPTPIDLTDPASFTANFLNNFGGGTVDGAEAALIAGLQAGRAYFNVHTSFAPGGEIRGFLQQVPEPATLGFVVLGMIGTFAARRKHS